MKYEVEEYRERKTEGGDKNKKRKIEEKETLKTRGKNKIKQK